MELMKMVMMKSLQVKMWSLETMTMKLIWWVYQFRKKLGKILEEFQDAIVRIDKDSFPQKENLLDESRFENWFVIPENVYADESRLLKDFLDLDSAKGETAYITTISGRERIHHISVPTRQY